MKRKKQLGRPPTGLTEQLTVHFTRAQMRSIAAEARKRGNIPFATVVRDRVDK